MKAVFLDRDGTLIVDPPNLRVDSVEEVELLPKTLEALRELKLLDYGIFIVSNQAGVGEGRITLAESRVIHAEVVNQLSVSGIQIIRSYICPHLSEDNCECRKPKPKFILDAAAKFDIDLTASWMVGDRETDILGGKNAGTHTILVQTGVTPATETQADYIATDLLEAVRYIADH